MKTIILTIAMIISSTNAFAGTARTLSMSEQFVVASAMATVLPSIVTGNEASLENCALGNKAAQGKVPVLVVECEYIATTTQFKGIAKFDSLQMNGEEIVGASFKSLAR